MLPNTRGIALVLDRVILSLWMDWWRHKSGCSKQQKYQKWERHISWFHHHMYSKQIVCVYHVWVMFLVNITIYGYMWQWYIVCIYIYIYSIYIYTVYIYSIYIYRYFAILKPMGFTKMVEVWASGQLVFQLPVDVVKDLGRSHWLSWEDSWSCSTWFVSASCLRILGNRVWFIWIRWVKIHQHPSVHTKIAGSFGCSSKIKILTIALDPCPCRSGPWRPWRLWLQKYDHRQTEVPLGVRGSPTSLSSPRSRPHVPVAGYRSWEWRALILCAFQPLVFY